VAATTTYNQCSFGTAEILSRPADGSGRRIAGSAFETTGLERELRLQTQATPAAKRSTRSARAAGVPVVVGALLAIKKGLAACEKLEKTFVLRPVAKACQDFYERKFYKLVREDHGGQACDGDAHVFSGDARKDAAAR
jgi:hypothetical protein